MTAITKEYISGGKTGHWAMPPTKVEIKLIFPNFLRSKVLNSLTTREAIFVQNLLCYNHGQNI